PVAEAAKTDVSRIALAQEMTTGGLTERLKRDFRVKTYAFGEDLREQTETAGPLEATGKRTNVARALNHLGARLANETVSAVFLLTDGGDNGLDDPLAAAAAFRARGTPVHCIGLGSAKPLKDIQIQDLSLHRRVSMGTLVTADLTLKSEAMDGVTVPVVLTEVKPGSAGKVVKRQEVTLKGGQQQVRLDFSPTEEGVLRYVVSIPAQPGEAVKENNSETFVVHSSKDILKVLYMEGTQRRVTGRELWEHQYLVKALEEDKDVQVTTLFRDDVEAARRVGISHVRDPVNGFPQDKAKLYEYDVLISSDIDIDYFSEKQLANTVDFVAEHGGGFVMIGGYTAFGTGGYHQSVIDKMLPVEMQGRGDGYTEGPGHQFRWVLTPEGRAHAIMQIDPDMEKNLKIWEGMPLLNGFNHVLRAKPGATVLAVHPKRRTEFGPSILLAIQQYGRGRSMAFVTDTTAGWGEQFEAEFGDGGDNQFYRKFWQNALRWLAAYQLKVPHKRIVIRSSANRYNLGDTAEIYAEALDEHFEPTFQAEVWAE
ncbi:MAG: hypothetical protein FJ278_19275, partial [Planctomycetes bacterium]|nr:hypothetical protein [Planctomycetota bacterium]